MIVCPNCGNANPDGSRFCANCGADLTGAGRTPPTPREPPRPEAPSTVDRRDLPPTSPEWRMSPAGPLPEPPRRRRWLWIVLGIVGACLLLCCLLLVWGNTIGVDTINDLATRVSIEATEQGGAP